MTADRWRRIEDLFSQALDCPVAERTSFLDRACEGDAELRCELESLLACDTPSQPLVAIPAGLVEVAGEPDRGLEMAGRRIGSYRLIRPIGQGGMGAVYLGVRADDQYQKQVAIKLLKRGMDTDAMLYRFRQERQILANLEHPFIARLIDGGATEEGLPYFVMEYVDGVPITSYCDARSLSILERLRLFRMVCEAVQHAHQNLVVHRDLKPSNILTTREGVPKLLDFGIAKMLDPTAAGNTLTQREHRMLTPDYASPEQIKGLPISTASDTYSLGAVLYELLSGRRPHQFTSGSLADIEKTICEVEPEKPSSAVSKRENLAPAVRIQLRRQLAGDLDNIVLAAMRKEPQHRYASAAELSEDLRRHMEGLPVLAREDRWSYRASKFVRRNRLAAGAVFLVTASLVGGIITTTIQARRAERRFQLVRQLAHTVAFDLYDQVERLPGSTSAQAAMVQTVVQYLDRLALDSGGDPALDLEIAKTYARVAAVEGYPFGANLGHAVLALGHYQKAITIFERLRSEPSTAGEATQSIVQSHIQAASIELVLGKHSLATAHLRKAATIAADASPEGRLGPGILAAVNMDLGALAADLGDTDTELTHMSKAVEICRQWSEKEPGADSLSTLQNAYSQLAKARAHAGDLYGAQDGYVTALQVASERERRSDVRYISKTDRIGIHHIFGDLLGATDDLNLGRPAEALLQYREAAALGESYVAADASNVNARRNLAGSYRRIGLVLLEDRPLESLGYYHKAVEISGVLTESEPRNVHYRSALSDGLLGVGQALSRLGRRTEALHTLGRVIDLQKSIESAAPEQLWLQRTTSRAHLAIGNLFATEGKTEQALTQYREGLAAAERTLRRFPSSLPLALDRAELLESMGAYYLTLAKKANTPGDGKAQWKEKARACYQDSLTLWRDWQKRRIGVPYVERRMKGTLATLSAIERL